MAIEDMFFLFLIGLIFFLGTLINSIYKFSKAKIDSLKKYYLWAIIANIILILSMIFGLLQQLIPMVILFSSVGVVGLLRIKKSIKAQREEVKETVPEIQKKELKFWDLFTRSGWIKMALKFGIAETIFITFFIEFIILFLLSILIKEFIYTKLTYFYVFFNSLGLAIIISIMSYLTLRKIRKE